MAKFPNSPGAAALAVVKCPMRTLPAGTRLARVYFSGGLYPRRWNEFRRFGPLSGRWDHHLPGPTGAPQLQKRAIYYSAQDAKTCLAEFFQQTRRIDRAFQSPWLVVFELTRTLRVLDLMGDISTRIGASMALHSGSRGRARGWARDFYEAYPESQGIAYASSMNGGAMAYALNERAESAHPPHPLFHRALVDDALLDSIKKIAEQLGFALR